jgi:MoxR-like ATPase
MESLTVQQWSRRVKEQVQRVIVGKDDMIDLMLVALLGSGHILLEDVPGTGKTMLAKTLARSLNCTFKRVQFTPDLLPSDLSGIHFYNQKLGEFEFRPGPLFTNILLADEINRATPRTQSSLLECMEERQVSIDGETIPLARPFLVMATQNPVDNQGTFPLPEAQLDRFLVKIRMGYPTTREAVQILKRFQREQPLDAVVPAAEAEEIAALQQACLQVFVHDDILEYVVQLVEQSREHPDVALGISPRGSQALLKAAQVYAAMQGRSFVVPEDVKRMCIPVLAHRLIIKNQLLNRDAEAARILQSLLDRIPAPTETFASRG